MVSIQILSDLHLEAPKSYDVFEITPSAPYLALLGDIGCVKDPGYFSFLEKQLPKFRMVFLVLGNHEPYHSSWTTIKEKVRLFEKECSVKNIDGRLGSFIFMDQTRCDVSPSVTILGCTLFSNVLLSQMNNVSFGLNDFYHIESWTVEEHNEKHAADLQWLNTQVKSITETEPARKVIILTHYCPTTSPEAIDPKHRQSTISSGFSTDLSGELCWTSRSVRVWAFGHTHFNCNFIEHSTEKRVVTNQRGYYFSESVGYNANYRIELED